MMVESADKCEKFRLINVSRFCLQMILTLVDSFRSCVAPAFEFEHQSSLNHSMNWLNFLNLFRYQPVFQQLLNEHYGYHRECTPTNFNLNVKMCVCVCVCVQLIFVQKLKLKQTNKNQQNEKKKFSKKPLQIH